MSPENTRGPSFVYTGQAGSQPDRGSGGKEGKARCGDRAGDEGGEGVKDCEEAAEWFVGKCICLFRSRFALKKSLRTDTNIQQGALGGAGIGATLGMGLGGVVGTLVGGVVSIPTTGLGTLAGVATGAIHGPWYGKKKKEELEDELQGDEGSKKDAKATEIAMENDEG